MHLCAMCAHIKKPAAVSNELPVINPKKPIREVTLLRKDLEMNHGVNI